MLKKIFCLLFITQVLLASAFANSNASVVDNTNTANQDNAQKQKIIEQSNSETQAIKQDNKLSELVKKLLPAVVSIRTTNIVDTSLNSYDGRYYYYNQTDSISSIGSGFLISTDGYILTNTHVVENSDSIYVMYKDREYLAELVGSDTISDIAVLKIKSIEKLPYFELKDDIEINIGEEIIVIGNPYDLGVSVSSGIISAINRNIKGTEYNNLIQTDAAINKGNSGGPMFNLNGDVIGITSMIFSTEGNNIGLGFAIPIKNIMNIVERLKMYGYVQRGWLGVKAIEVDNSILKILNSKRQGGIFVKEVVKNSSAEKYGILPSDVIISYNNVQVKTVSQLNAMIRETSVDSEASVLILRKGELKRIKVRIKELPSKFDLELEKIKGNSIDIFDMYLTSIDDNLIEKFELYSNLKGLFVLDVKAGGWADNNGIERGDIILTANQVQLKTKQDLIKIIQEAKLKNKKDILFIIRKTKNKENILLKLNLNFINY